MKMSKNWEIASGDWDILKSGFKQSSMEGTTRLHRELGYKDWVVKFTTQVLGFADPEHGEIKFLFSDAASGEAFRIDLMFNVGACRITTGNWQFPRPLFMVTGKDYRIRIAMRRNLLSVQVDQIEVVKDFPIGKESNGSIGVGTYQASVVFSDFEVTPFETKSCFVIMPFDQKRNFLYEYVIKQCLENHPDIIFEYIRADESATIGKISEEISESIKDSDIIIADITEKSMNVYYELGYSHALSKKAVLLIEKIENQKLDIPFDIQDFRCHSYSFSKEGFKKIEDKLSKVLTTIL